MWQRGNAALPEWLVALGTDKPLVWVYSGNPRYGGAGVSTAIDSIVVIRATIAALADAPVHVVLTTGYQEVLRRSERCRRIFITQRICLEAPWRSVAN